MPISSFKTLALSGALAVLSCPTSSLATTAIASLADVYADSFRIGVGLNTRQIRGDAPDDSRVITEHFNSYTAENEMKWERIHPEETEYDFASGDALAALGEKHDGFVVGHTLVWHNQTPNWVFEDTEGQPATREMVLRRMEDHIATVMGRYQGRIAGWDVVNEALNEDGTLRDTTWRELIGDDYIAKAFEFAHAADPDAKLYYNDYNLWKPEKRAGAVALVQDLQARGVPVHGVGIQGHFGLDSPPLELLEASIAAFGALGVTVMITELDVSVLPFPSSDQWGADLSVSFALREELNPYTAGLPPDVRVAQDNQYRALFALFLKHREVIDRVTLWNLNDATSWKNNWPIVGRTDYPVLFDRQNRPKSTVRALIDLKRAYDQTP